MLSLILEMISNNESDLELYIKNLGIQIHPQKQFGSIREKYQNNELFGWEWPLFSFLMEFQFTLPWIDAALESNWKCSCHFGFKSVSLIFQWLEGCKWNLPTAMPLKWPTFDSSEYRTFPIGNPLKRQR